MAVISLSACIGDACNIIGDACNIILPGLLIPVI